MNNLPAKSEFPTYLTEVTPWPTLGAIALDWLVIAGAIALAVAHPGVVTFLLAQVLVASRQHALFLIFHEGTHYLICRNKQWNDRISNFFAAWPLLFSTERYRIRHWTHHRHLNTEKDPDYSRKKEDPNWRFPMSHRRYWATTLPYLFGKGFLEMSYALQAFGVHKRDLPLAGFYYAAAIAAITFSGGWKIFALYWALPFFTGSAFLHRNRNASEHLGLPHTHALNGTRNVFCGPVESFLLNPHNGSVHLLHHHFPFVPWHKLRAAHSFLCESNSFYRDNAYANDAYFLPTGRDVYGDLTRQTTQIEKNQKAA